MITLTFLGVGGALASQPADNHTAMLLQRGELTLLLDCGPTIMRQLEQADLTAGDPTHVYISHQHGDHLLGLPMLLLNRVLFWPERPLWVVGEAQVLALAQDLVRIAYPDLESEITPTVRFAALSESSQADLPGAPGVRYALARGRHSVPSWGIRLELGATSVVYSSDTAPSREIEALAAGASVLVHEAFFVQRPEQPSESHSVAEDVGMLAARAAVQTLALVHRKDPGAEAAPVYCAAAGRAFRGRIVAPLAGERLAI